jgi:hypothetical protein
MRSERAIHSLFITLDVGVTRPHFPRGFVEEDRGGEPDRERR